MFESGFLGDPDRFESRGDDRRLRLSFSSFEYSLRGQVGQSKLFVRFRLRCARCLDVSGIGFFKEVKSSGPLVQINEHIG